jgi:hypothetical protein
MSSPDITRFDRLVRELRASGVTASPELRERVRGIASREPEPPAREWFRPLGFGPRSRRACLVLAPVAALAGIAIGFGLVSSGGGGKQKAAPEVQHGLTSLVAPTHAQRGAAPKAYDSATGTLPPSGSRPQLYAVEMELRVGDLSATTKSALDLTRSFGGYIRSVQYGSGQMQGTAYLVLRIPIGQVQKAVVRLSALGAILDQHVSIQDVKPQVDARSRAIQGLREQIAGLKVKLAAAGLTAARRAALELRLTRTQGRLDALRLAQRQALTRASFATVSLDLRTKQAEVVAPSKPGRIGGALHEIGVVLVREAEILLYVLLIGGPFVVLAALLWLGRRSIRRRSEEHLLAR